MKCELCEKTISQGEICPECALALKVGRKVIFERNNYRERRGVLSIYDRNLLKELDRMITEAEKGGAG